MLYLLDANVLIEADEAYYGIDLVPQFWDWLLTIGSAGVAKIPFEIHGEITGTTSRLGKWINTTEAKKALILEEIVDIDTVNKVLTRGYAPDLTDSELEKIGRDPFLIAYALAGADRVIVTKETPAPSKKRANRKIPDICNDFGVKWMKDFDFFRRSGFNTK